MHLSSARLSAMADERLGRDRITVEELRRLGSQVERVSAVQHLESSKPPDLLLLPLHLLGETCKLLSAAFHPELIVLHEKNDADAVFAALEAGAAHACLWDGSPRELLAHVRAVLRRRDLVEKRRLGAPCQPFPGVRLDPVTGTLSLPTCEPMPLTAREFRLLEVLCRRPKEVLSRSTLLDLAFGPEAEVYDRSVDVTVCRLRKKLTPAASQMIRTYEGVGYSLWPPGS